MTTRKRTKQTAPLIVEPHPKSYNGYPFITLLQFRQKHVLSIVDNIDTKTIKAFVLDYCGPEGINEESIINIASQWYDEMEQRYPISIEFSKRGITPITSKLYRSYNIEYVSRVIGPLPEFPMQPTANIKRRRRKPLPTNVEIHDRIIKF